MHRCIRVPEIVQIICKSLDRPDCLSMALTSKLFLEPALDELWFYVDSFEPIIGCLPVDILKKDLWHEENGILSFRRPLEPADIERYITLYAPRIRRIFLYFDPEVPRKCLSIEALQALQLVTNYQCGVLSPSLQHFRWPVHDEVKSIFGGGLADKLYPLMSLFIPGNLASMDVWSCRRFASSGLLFMSSLRSVARRLTSVKRLDIGGNEEPDVDRDHLMTSFAWDGLEEITIGVYTIEALVHLATLPRLHTMEISIPDQLPAFDKRSNTDFFPSLRVLKPKCGSLACARDLLQYLPPKNRVHTLSFACEFGNYRGEYDDPLLLVGQYCNPLFLERLELCDMGCEYRHSFAYSDTIDPLFDLQEPFSLDPLYAFRRLKHLEINILGGIRVDPGDIQKIREAWPEIQYLDVRSSTSISDRLPLLNHRHVIELLTQVPSIRTLGLRFDATNISKQEPVPDKPLLLNKLCVGETPLCSPDRVLNFLTTQFPKLRDLETHYGLTSDDAMMTEDHIMNKRWALVIRRWKEHAAA